MKKEQLSEIAGLLVLAESWEIEIDEDGNMTTNLQGTGKSVLAGMLEAEKVTKQLSHDPTEDMPVSVEDEPEETVNELFYSVGDIVRVNKNHPNYSDAVEGKEYTVKLVEREWVALEGLIADIVGNEFLVKVSSIKERDGGKCFVVGDKVRVTTEGCNDSNALTGVVYTVETVHEDTRYLRLQEIPIAGWVSFNNAEHVELY